jgi:hypothetical protein
MALVLPLQRRWAAWGLRSAETGEKALNSMCGLMPSARSTLGSQMRWDVGIVLSISGPYRILHMQFQINR